MMCLYGSEDNLVIVILLLLENQTQTRLQVVRFGSKFSYLLSYFVVPFGFSLADKIFI